MIIFGACINYVLVVQSLSCVWYFETPWAAAHQASLSFTISHILLRLMFIEFMMPSKPHILCCPLLLLVAPQFSLVQLLSCVWLFSTPWIAERQASLCITNSRSSLKLTSIKSVMPSSHLILCCPLLFLPPIPPSISLFQWVNSSHEVAKVLEFQL